MPTKFYQSKVSATDIFTNEVGVVSTSDASYFPANRSRTWVNTPNFRSKVKGRKKRTTVADLPMNALTEYSYYADPSWQAAVFYNGTRKGSITGYFCKSVGVVPTLTDGRLTSLYYQALSRLPSKMNGQSFNLPLFLAELHKSIDMIHNAAQILDKASRTYASLTAKQKNGLMPWNLWLEYRYGWRLLAKDIYDGLCTIHDIQTNGVKQRARASAKLVIPDTYSYGPVNMYPFNSTFRWTGLGPLIRTTTTLRVDVTVHYREYSPVLSTLQQLGITNPMLLAWELIPFSFVADWFIPVGDYLQSFDRFLGKEFVKGCACYMIETDNYSKVSGPLVSGMYPSLIFKNTADPTSRYRIRLFKREPLGSFPQNSLPTIDININGKRLADGLALIAQSRKRIGSFLGSP